MDNQKIDEFVLESFNDFGSIPQISKLVSHSSDTTSLQLKVELAYRNDAEKKKTKCILDINHSLVTKQSDVEFGPSAVEVTSKSPSKSVQLWLKTVDNKRFLQIVTDSTFKCIEVTKIHGDFYDDDFFANISWSDDKVVYVAQPNAPEESAKDYRYSYDAGECYTGKRKACPVIVSEISTTPKALMLDSLPFFSISQPIICNDYLVFVGVANEPTQLGLRFCTNRNSSLYRCKLDGSGLEELGKRDTNARFPVKIPNTNSILFLTYKIGGPHDSCAALLRYDLDSGVESIVVSVVDRPAYHHGFPGLFTRQLRHDAFIITENDTWIIVDGFWRSRVVIMAISLATKQVINLTPDGKESYTLLGTTKNNYVLAVKSSLSMPECIVCLPFPQNTTAKFDWNLVFKPKLSDKLQSIFENLVYDVETVDGESSDVEIIVLRTSKPIHPRLHGRTKLPVVIAPHGGPHGTYATSYMQGFTGLAALGFTTILINYSGSIGFGNDAINSLLGKIGTLDVSQTHNIAQKISKKDYIDSSNVFYQGGSHGGFIGSHLATLYPHFYRAFSIRNPVVNVGGMPFETDIPDWCFSEAGIQTNNYNDLKPQGNAKYYIDYERMYRASAVSFFKGNAAPILLLLGKKDRRVPPSQGLRWYELLKQNQCEIELLVFPEDGHALDRFETQQVAFCSTVKFFIDRLQ